MSCSDRCTDSRGNSHSDSGRESHVERECDDRPRWDDDGRDSSGSEVGQARALRPDGVGGWGGVLQGERI